MGLVADVSVVRQLAPSMGMDFAPPQGNFVRPRIGRFPAPPTMESTAFLSRPRRSAYFEEPTLGASPFAVGQEIRIAVGPLAGMRGSLLKQALDGRWVVQLADVAAGVLFCVDANHFDRR